MFYFFEYYTDHRDLHVLTHSSPTRRTSCLRVAPGTSDPAARALWRAHQHRIVARLKGLKVRLPRPGLAAADPWALRGLVALLVVVGFTSTEGDIRGRLAAAVTPSFNRAPLRSEEHTSELQVTNAHLVCSLLLEKKKQKTN